MKENLMKLTAGRHLYTFYVFVRGYDANHTYRELHVEEIDVESGADTFAALSDACREAALLYEDFRLELKSKI